MQQFYGDKYASKAKCVVVQVNSKTQKKVEKETRKMWVSQHDTNAFLSYASDGKWKMFFLNAYFYMEH